MTSHEVEYDAEFWDERYRSAGAVWSGNPNPRLVEVAEGLPAGAALDVGCGEGADAIWLAGRGWQVTGVDVSQVALDRAAGLAAAAGVTVGWEQVDARDWAPEPDRYDLVSAQFLHLPPDQLTALLGRLATAVRPGGTLLAVGHHPDDLGTSMRRPHRPDLMPTAEQLAAGLDLSGWRLTTTAPTRQTTDPDGRSITIRDAVLLAVRDH